MKTRDHWRKLARKTNDPLAWAGYKNFKREVKRELRFAEQEYAETQIRNNSNNTGCVWKLYDHLFLRNQLTVRLTAKRTN
jgi:hypothetical protein